MIDGDGTYKEERNVRFSLSTPKEIARGLNRICESKMITPSLARIVQDVSMTLKVLEIFHRANGDALEGLTDSNVHRQKVVGKGKSVS